MDNIWTFLVSSGILAAVLGLGLVGINYLKAWINAKTADLAERLHDDKVKDAVVKAENLISLAVVETAQVEADAFKKAAEDGKITDEEKAQLKQIALDRANKLIKDDLAVLVTESVGDYSAWLESQIENAVFYSKK